MRQFWSPSCALSALALSTVSNAAFADEPPQIPPSTTQSPPPSTAPNTAGETSSTLPPSNPETPPPAAPSTTEITTIQAAPKSSKGTPRLHIEANRPGVRLLQIQRAMSDDTGEGLLVRTICSAPCDQIIDGRKGQTFFFGAEGMVPSRGFKLSRLEGNLVARVQGGSIIARQLGFLIGGFGGTAMIGGVTMLSVGYGGVGTTLSSEGKIVEGENTTLTTGGFITLGVGTVMVVSAIVMVATSKTKITLFQSEDKSARVTLEMGKLTF